MTPLISMRNLSKNFPGVQALSHVQFELLAGEVHALMGENGAGKSTLMKILAGVYSKDGGEILYDGEEVAFANPREAQHAGIGIIHQELQLMNHLTVAKRLARDCDILFFDEPTRGIDVGAKSEIYKLLRELANQGKAIVMISSELPEILRMSDRIVVMCEGRITGKLLSQEATHERVMQSADQRETMAA
jgi:ABC-type sugar transport system ATPase subunit